MTVSIIMSNTPNSVGIAYSFVSWLNNFDELKPSIDLNVYGKGLYLVNVTKASTMQSLRVIVQ